MRRVSVTAALGLVARRTDSVATAPASVVVVGDAAVMMTAGPSVSRLMNLIRVARPWYPPSLLVAVAVTSKGWSPSSTPPRAPFTVANWATFQFVDVKVSVWDGTSPSRGLDETRVTVTSASG